MISVTISSIATICARKIDQMCPNWTHGLISQTPHIKRYFCITVNLGVFESGYRGRRLPIVDSDAIADADTMLKNC